MAITLRSCDGKQQFKTAAEANSVIARMNVGQKKKLKSYKCRFCGFFHFGHQKKAMAPYNRSYKIKLTDFK